MNVYTKKTHIKNGIIGASKNVVDAPTPLHRHIFFELEYIVSGTGYQIIDGIPYPIKSGKIFFLSPANFHSIESNDTVLLNIRFPCEINNDYSVMNLLSQNYMSEFLLNERDAILIKLLCEDVIESVERNDNSSAIQYLNSILKKLSSYAEINDTKTTHHIKKAILHILENFTSGITLKDTAKHTGLAEAYLSDLFTKETGMGFKKYMDNLRFDYAEKLLLFSDFTVTEICEMSGFTDYANFMRRFKNRYKISPSAFRKLNQKT